MIGLWLNCNGCQGLLFSRHTYNQHNVICILQSSAFFMPSFLFNQWTTFIHKKMMSIWTNWKKIRFLYCRYDLKETNSFLLFIFYIIIQTFSFQYIIFVRGQYCIVMWFLDAFLYLSLSMYHLPPTITVKKWVPVFLYTQKRCT